MKKIPALPVTPAMFQKPVLRVLIPRSAACCNRLQDDIDRLNKTVNQHMESNAPAAQEASREAIVAAIRDVGGRH